MRNNLPITDTEYVLPDQIALVSMTGLDSRITYANPAFIETSGFTKDELLGQPHNLVRHPDMPPEAYADLWRTIKAGQQWTAPVKNRRKNGDYYWVKANITPIIKNGRPVGYMSVRVKPSREEIAQADALYRAIRTGANRHGVCAGHVVRTGVLGKLLRWTHPDIQTRIWLALLTLLLAMVGFAAIALPGFGTGLGWAGIGALGGFGLLVAGGLGWWLYRSVAKPLREVATMSQRIAGADLTGRFGTTRDDTLGLAVRGLNQTNVNLWGIVSDVRAQVHGVHDAAADIGAGIEDLSTRTEAQASNLQQTAASMEQIHATVQQTADLARQANRLVLSAASVAEQGGRAVDQLAANMADIDAGSAKIADIIGVIDEVAFHTNILALNAAVEAARAGEQGRGFAVVADEVRNLAQKTATAAREIKHLITDSLAKVASGSKLSDEAGKTMAATVSAISGVATIMGDINRATDEQAAGIAQVNTAAMQLDRATQENAAFADRINAAALLLNYQANTLREAVGIFHIS